MKQKLVIAIVVVALLAGAVGAAWLYFRFNPGAWETFVAEMQGEGGARTASRPSARPVQRTARRSTRLRASGNVEAEEVSVAAEAGGRIVEMRADEGDEVEAGAVLVSIDPVTLLTQRDQAMAATAQAEAAVDAARAQLDLARAGARAEEIAAAEATVEEARAGLDAAQGQLAAAKAGLEAAQAQWSAAEVGQKNATALAKAAQAELDGAQVQLSAARTRVKQIEAGLAQSRVLDLAPERTAAQVAVERAKIALDDVQDEYNKALDRPWEDQEIRDAWAKQLKQVRLDYRLAQAQLDGVEQAQQARAYDLAALAAQVEEAKVHLTSAGIEGAEAGLAQAEAGQKGAEIQAMQAESETEAAQAGVVIAQAGVDAARARLGQAEATLALLRAGARAQEIALLEARAAQAEAQLTHAQAAVRMLDAQLERLQLSAPIGGIVVNRTVHVGELAVPGAPLLTIANLDEVTLTVYVPEADLGQVSLGQEVEVTVDAYPDAFAGTVSHVASQAEFTPKNVQTQEERVHMVFAIKVWIENAEHRLKPGMPADAVFQ